MRPDAFSAVSSARRLSQRALSLPDRWLRVILLAPALLVLLLVFIYPLSYSFWLSLHSYDLINPMRFVGLRNYERILTDARVLNSIRVTFTLAIPTFVLEFTVGFALALLIHRNIIAKGLWRTIFLLPIMLTPVVVGLNWRVMLNYDFGVINYLLGRLGFPKQNWVHDPLLALPTIIVADLWHTTGFVMMVLAAGLATLPEEPYEAAEIDGASSWQRLWYITVPLLKPIFLVVALFRSYELIRIFDKVYTLTNGGPGRATETLSLHIFNRMFEGWQVGYSAAIAYVLFFISLVVSLALIRLIGTGDIYGSEESS